ncbi:uncharacterized protein BJ171DRAFT_51550 [Polychytrium aggregatum]|uniref:uncharacterized protein n=1 Tax=Polychytrium aggregatum TaxID=110093 RepID=UPI0022FEA2E3|nr:uncharacterized protein BJ171DRAFT_51550 [Polychytrium aggregatum]KAI9205749.1 hypothetical protein BJ171DRAFT_51550 [Polychytrium aggregatum]
MSFPAPAFGSVTQGPFGFGGACGNLNPSKTHPSIGLDITGGLGASAGPANPNLQLLPQPQPQPQPQQPLPQQPLPQPQPHSQHRKPSPLVQASGFNTFPLAYGKSSTRQSPLIMRHDSPPCPNDRVSPKPNSFGFVATQGSSQPSTQAFHPTLPQHNFTGYPNPTLKQTPVSFPSGESLVSGNSIGRRTPPSYYVTKQSPSALTTSAYQPTGISFDHPKPSSAAKKNDGWGGPALPEVYPQNRRTGAFTVGRSHGLRPNPVPQRSSTLHGAFCHSASPYSSENQPSAETGYPGMFPPSDAAAQRTRRSVMDPSFWKATTGTY